VGGKELAVRGPAGINRIEYTGERGRRKEGRRGRGCRPRFSGFST